jgi:hypothetical protein
VGGTAPEAGVQPGDRILSIGDVAPRPIDRSRRAAVLHFDVLARHSAGDTAAWRYDRAGVTLAGTAVFRGLPEGLITTHAIVQAVFWLLALSLLWLRHDRVVVRLLAYGVLANTAGQFFRPITDLPLDSAVNIVLQEVCAIGRFLGPALVVHFALVFPVRTTTGRARTRILAVAYGVPFVLFVVEQWLLIRGALSESAPYLLYTGALSTLHYGDVRYLVYIACWIGAGALMMRSLRVLRAAPERDQVKWVMWSVFTAIAAEVMLIAFGRMRSGTSGFVIQQYINLVYIVIAFGIAVAVMRHDLFDIDRVIRQSVVYFATMGIVFALFTSGENLLTDLFLDLLPGGAGGVGTLLSGVIAAAIFVPLRRVIDRFANRVAPQRMRGGLDDSSAAVSGDAPSSA